MSPAIRLAVLGWVVALAATASHAAPTLESPQPVATRQDTAANDYRKGVEALHAGQLDRAEAAALGLVETASHGSAGRHLLGLVKTRKGDLAGAVAEFDKALVNDPQSIPARTERAVVLARLGQLDKARVDLDALKARAALCGKACAPELRSAISRVEAALAAGRPPAA